MITELHGYVHFIILFLLAYLCSRSVTQQGKSQYRAINPFTFLPLKLYCYQSSPKLCQLLCVAPHQPTAQLPAYLLNAPLGPEAPASSLSLDDLSVRVEPLREALVLTTLSSRAHLRVALILQHPVEALGLQATRVLVGGLAVTAGDLRQVSDLDLYLPDDFVGLESASTTKKGGRQR